jgi:hypothetical protein
VGIGRGARRDDRRGRVGSGADILAQNECAVPYARGECMGRPEVPGGALYTEPRLDPTGSWAEYKRAVTSRASKG